MIWNIRKKSDQVPEARIRGWVPQEKSKPQPGQFGLKLNPQLVKK